MTEIFVESGINSL